VTGTAILMQQCNPGATSDLPIWDNLSAVIAPLPQKKRALFQRRNQHERSREF
jgi:hypothetical protein